MTPEITLIHDPSPLAHDRFVRERDGYTPIKPIRVTRSSSSRKRAVYRLGGWSIDAAETPGLLPFQLFVPNDEPGNRAVMSGLGQLDTLAVQLLDQDLSSVEIAVYGGPINRLVVAPLWEDQIFVHSQPLTRRGQPIQLTSQQPRSALHP